MIYSKAKSFIKANHSTMTCTELARATGLQPNTIVIICLHIGVAPMPRKYKGRLKIEPEEYTTAKSKMERPPAIYTNSPSPFGIADELHKIRT